MALELSRGKATDRVARDEASRLRASEDMLRHAKRAVSGVTACMFTVAILTMSRPPSGRAAAARAGVSGRAGRT